MRGGPPPATRLSHPNVCALRTLAAIQPASTIEIPYGPNWQLPVQNLLAAQAAVTLVASPNSPSGHIVPLADLKLLAQGLAGVLAIDEAYVDFAGQTALELVRTFPNVIVLRTLSKGYALAGLRLGFGCAQPALLKGLLKIKDSYNVDAIALRLGTAALLDQKYKNTIIQKVIAAREQLSVALQTMAFRIWPSHTNFLLVQPPNDSCPIFIQKPKSAADHDSLFQRASVR